MSLILDGRHIEDVGVIDDSEDGRQTLSEELEDTDYDFRPLPFTGPFQNVDELFGALAQRTQAVICDHRLSTRNFAPFTGAEVVSRCYREHFPSVLTTTYSGIGVEIARIRLYRRYIPTLLTFSEATPDAIIKGWETCILEFRGHFRPSRKPWRTLVRVADKDDDYKEPILSVVIPAWNSDEKVSLLLSNVPDDLQPHMTPGARFYARVNIGAERQEDLYFDEFEWHGT